jgi:hypothetical protein
MSTPIQKATERRPFEAWVAEKKPAPWQSNAARAMRGWAIGREVTEAEFDDAVKAAGAVVLSSDLKR